MLSIVRLLPQWWVLTRRWYLKMSRSHWIFHMRELCWRVDGLSLHVHILEWVLDYTPVVKCPFTWTFSHSVGGQIVYELLSCIVSTVCGVSVLLSWICIAPNHVYLNASSTILQQTIAFSWMCFNTSNRSQSARLTVSFLVVVYLPACCMWSGLDRSQ